MVSFSKKVRKANNIAVTPTLSNARPSYLHLRVSTLNCWGLYFSPDRQARFHAIIKVLKNSSLDIIALQEVWIMSDWLKLRQGLASCYPYAEYYSTGIIGSGLAILSKWPIVQIAWHKFSLNGAPNWIHHGDWFAGKGVAMARILVDEKYLVDVYNSHTHAEYCKIKLRYLLHQVSQLCELRRMIESFSSRSYFQGNQQASSRVVTTTNNNNKNNLVSSSQPSLVLAMGDWNCWSDGLAYEAVIKNGAMVSFDGQFMPLTDAWLEHHLEQIKQDDAVSIDKNFNQVGCTYNDKESKYHCKGDPEERLDYIHFHKLATVSNNNNKEEEEEDGRWGCTNTEIIKKSPTGQWLSDHAMLIVTLGPKDRDRKSNSVVEKIHKKDSFDHHHHQRRLASHNQHILDYIERDLRGLRLRQLLFRLLWIAFLMLFLGLFIVGSLASLETTWRMTPRTKFIVLIISPVFLIPTFMCALVSEMFLRDERAGVKMMAQQWISWYKASIVRFGTLDGDGGKTK